MDRVELQKALNVVKDLIQTTNFQIPQHVDVSSQSEKIRKFLTSQERAMALKADFDASKMLVDIVGMDEEVTKAISALKQFFETMNILPGYNPPRVWKFLEIHFEEIKEKNKSLGRDVPVQLEKQASGEYQISITGTDEDIVLCEDELNKLIRKITQKEETIASPGLTKFLKATNGQDEVKRIEKNRIVYIEPQFSTELSSMLNNSLSASTLPLNVTVQDTKNSRLQHEINENYSTHNFITTEGLQFSCKVGRIEDQKVSVSESK